MQLIIDIKNESIADKIKTILSAFKNDGIEVQELKTKNQKPETTPSSEYSTKDWKEVVMNTHSADRDDDEYLYEAAWEFYHEKHSD